MNNHNIGKDTVSVDGITYNRVVTEEEILICTLNGYKYFLGPEYDVDFLGPEYVGKYTGELDWDAAKKWCESLGEGYELPNRLVMLAICMDERAAALLSKYSYYWTSSEYNASSAWVQQWLSSAPGRQTYDSKSLTYRVRAVRRSRIEGKT